MTDKKSAPGDEAASSRKNHVNRSRRPDATHTYKENAEADDQNAKSTRHRAPHSQAVNLATQNSEAIKPDLSIADTNLTQIESPPSSSSFFMPLMSRVASTDWAIWPIHQTRKILDGMKLLPRACQRAGGYKRAIRKAFKVYRESGVSGMRLALQRLSDSKRNDYVEWVRRYDTLTDITREKMRTVQTQFGYRPLISVLMPTFNTKAEWLIAAIESVRVQIYTNWELCIADDASTDVAVRDILQNYAKEDQRIKVDFRASNGNISEASNSALQLASGQWVALLDHDDLLSEHALFWVVDAINHTPDAQLIYSDEDKLDAKLERLDPYFKCDWNQDLFYSHNFINHLALYKTELIRQVGGFRQGFEGAQDYDLALRCSECIENNQIVHIPRVLYHWRLHDNGAASFNNAKPYATVAAERALNEHFCRIGLQASVSYNGIGYKPRYEISEPAPLVSIIIPTKNGYQILRNCISSILDKTLYRPFEIIVIDNGSDDSQTTDYLNTLSEMQSMKVIRDTSAFNYSYLNNLGVRHATGDVLALLNNDTEVISEDWLTTMASHALRPEIGAVGAKLWYGSGKLQHGGVIVGLGGVAGHAFKYFDKKSTGYCGRMLLTQNYSAVTAACLVIRKAVYLEAGGFDEDNLSVAFNDVDFCLRLSELGYRNVWTPDAELYHHESLSRGHDDVGEKHDRLLKEIQYMQQRWKGSLTKDPAYSPNLTLDHEAFSLAWPPRVKL